MISHKKEFIFIHIPKTSGNSLSLYLKTYLANKVIRRTSRVGPGQGIDIICEKNKCDIKHKTITYYRGMYPELYNKYFKFTIVRNPYDRLISLYFWCRSNMPFTKESFIKFLSRGIRSQVSYLIDKDKVVMDHICKFENLQEDLGIVFDRLGIEEKMIYPHLNASKHDYYMSYYDRESIDIVNEKYDQDFELLGYEKINI